MRQFDRTAKWIVGGLAAAVAVSGLGVATAGTSGPASTYNAMTPCRLMDTRPGPDQIGGRATPLQAAEEVTVQVRGANGECSIPVEADAVTINVIAVNPTNDSFLSIWPADANNPGTSSLNYLAGAPPTPNFITTSLSAAGAITLFNQFGTVDLVVDVFGFYSDHSHDDRYYTKAQTDGAIAAAEAEVDGALGEKADTADVYTKAQVYTKAEVDALYPVTYIATATSACNVAIGCPGVAPVAVCSAGDSDILTGGGARIVSNGAVGSFPSGDAGGEPDGWTSDVDLVDGDVLEVYAICASND